MIQTTNTVDETSKQYSRNVEQEYICKCPQCGTTGHSIASIYLRENAVQEYEGSMRLSWKSGTIDLNSETHTRRAMIFKMPEKPEPENEDQEYFIAIIGMLSVFGAGVYIARNMIDDAHLSMTIGIILMLVMVVYFVIPIFFGNNRESAAEHRYGSALKKYKKQMKLYNSIRYCECCNILYENSCNICVIAIPNSLEEIMKKAE